MKTAVVKGFDYLRDKFSFSKAEQFAKCPRRAFYKYVQKLKLPAELVWRHILGGRAIHGGMETACYAKLRGETLTAGQQLDAAVAVYADEAKKEGLGADAAPIDEFSKEHKRQLEVYEASGERARLCPLPGSVEAPFEMTLALEGQPSVVFEGYTDFVNVEEDGTRRAIDVKSTQRAIAPAVVQEHLQLTLEAIGSEAPEAGIINFVAGARQRPTCKVSAPVKITQKRIGFVLKWLADTIGAFRRALTSGDFPQCSPTATWCNPRFCEFWSVCRGAGDDVSKYVSVSELKPVGFAPPAEWRQSQAGRIEAARAAAEENET